MRTFRGRLVALFVLSVMLPLLAVTFFLRSSIESRSGQDTLDHARTALETARRVLDDYLPSVSAARGRLGLLDDSLLSWLANAVGFDLSVYSPDARLLASSRRDLYAAGLLPSRVPGASFVAVGLGEARERTDARRIADSRFEEITTALSAVPGVPGVRSPVLLSLLLLPQQRVAEAEAAQLTAAVSAFSLLVFLISAAIAGRLAVRVARPVADLVEGTRAVARGDFSPQLEEPPDEELRELVRAFLYMSRSLKEQTEALSREKERLATLLAQLTAGVVAYGEDRRVLLANPASAHLGRGRVDGATLEEVFPGDAMRPVRAVLERFGPGYVSEELEPRPGERWRVVTVPLPLGGAGARMAVIEDVSDVVRSNRLAAWAEMARIIAHEIKNPLTPIRLSVEHLREVWKRQSPEFDRVLEECVTNVLRQTDELRRSAAEFSDYSRLPRPEMRPTDIGELVREAAVGLCGSLRDPMGRPGAGRAPGHGGCSPAGARASNLIGNSVEALARPRSHPAVGPDTRRPGRGDGRGRRPGSPARDSAAPLRSLFLGQERGDRARPRDRQEDRGRARRARGGGEPRRRRLSRAVRSPGARRRSKRLVSGRAGAALLAAALLAAPGCRAGKDPRNADRIVPKGNGVWLADAAASREAGLEDRLQRLGAAALFLPAGEVTFEGGQLDAGQRAAAGPADHPRPGRAGRSRRVPGARLRREDRGGCRGLGSGQSALSRSLGLRRRFGRVTGVLLDFPFSAATSERGAELVAAIKRALPGHVFVAIAMRASPGLRGRAQVARTARRRGGRDGGLRLRSGGDGPTRSRSTRSPALVGRLQRAARAQTRLRRARSRSATWRPCRAIPASISRMTCRPTTPPSRPST